MTAVSKIDSNATGLRYAEEVSFKTLPGSPVWNTLEPNTYQDFGGEPTLIAREPINDSRQRKKGVITDLDASGGINTDLTYNNLQDLMQGFFFADLRPKGEEIVTVVDVDATNPDEYQVASTTGFLVGNLIKGSNFLEDANNAVNEVTVIDPDVAVEVADGVLVDEPAPPADAQITVIGHVGASADIDVDVTGTFPALVSSSLDFTTLGLIEGEWIFIGGDTANSDFVAPANNGFKRIRTIAANRLEFDKSDLAMSDETGTSILLEMYFGRVLKNEATASIVRRTYNLERTLGAPDDAEPAEIQAEYVEGAVPSEMQFNIPGANKITVDLSFVGADSITIDGPTALKTGARPTLEDADAYNTSSDFSRIRMAQHTDGSEAPTPLFAFAEQLTISINNNVSPAKAVGTLGAFEVTAGTFQVGGSITAYFADVAAINAVRNNVDITLDMVLVKSNSGIVLDLPLIALGAGRPTVEKDQSVKLPLAMDAATAAKIDPNLDYTIMLVFFDYLPNAADT